MERQNLTMRMHNRRFTRLTNAFSKRIDHHVAAISLHFMYTNFVRIHQTLRCTPAMAAGVTDRLWEMSDIVALWTANASSAFRPDATNKRPITSGPTIPPARSWGNKIEPAWFLGFSLNYDLTYRWAIALSIASE